MFKNVIFDLDGTLTDPAQGIINSIRYATEKLGISSPSNSEMYSFIGPPLFDTFTGYYGLDNEKAELAINYYREYFSVTGLFENSVYSGIKKLLAELRSQGVRIILATSKPEIFARRILDHFGLSSNFHFIAGATLDSSRSRKCDVIAYALKNCGITDADSCVMVGDRSHDVLGAHQCNLPCIGVLYGYGSLEELLDCGADFIAGSIEELQKLLLNDS